jgi:hypothetical protein
MILAAAMSPEVKGAIVGGLLGAAVVVAAVLGEAWLARVWDRRRIVDATVLELVALMPQVINPISEAWDHEQDTVDTSRTSHWDLQRTRMENLWYTVIQNARWPMRDRKKLIAATNDTLAKWIAYETLWVNGRFPVTTVELLDFLAHGPASVTTRATDLAAEASAYEAKARHRRNLPPETILRPPRGWQA